MYTLGHDFVPPGIHAGGLRYHGASPLVSHLLQLGLHRGQGLPPDPGLRGGASSSPAPKASCRRPESSHAIRAAVDEALAAREEGRPRTILFCLSGHGHFDLAAYESYLGGKLQDFTYEGRPFAAAQ